MKKFFKKSAIIAALVLVLSIVISCEKDFTDIGSSIIKNTKFDTDSIVLDVLVYNAPVESVRADGIDLNFQPYLGLQGQYLLGVHINDDYENIEASIVSQVGINTQAELVSYKHPDNLQVITTIDTVFLRLPYQATLVTNTDKPVYNLDSIIGDKDLPFTLNVYRIDTYLSELNPNDPTKKNVYQSNATYQKTGSELNELLDMDFIPTTKDTLLYIKRKSSDGNVHKIDTVRYTAGTDTQQLPIPMAIIPLKKSFAQQVFLDNFGGSNFASQDAFNNYFRGIMIEAKEKNMPDPNNPNLRGGSLISFNFANTSSTINPFIEVYYTNTFIKNGTEIDTIISRNNSFQLTGIINNKFKMTDRVYPANNEVKIQGVGGSEAKVEILKGAELANLRAKNWLINDASLTFYVNQSTDATLAPNRLHLYKEWSNTNLSQVKDKYSESSTFGGFLEITNDKKDKYVFNITDYISDLLNGEIKHSADLKLKIYNPTDEATSDTIFRKYNWSPKAVTLLNQKGDANGARKAKLKISYSEKKK